jgi:hypothetical protein
MRDLSRCSCNIHLFKGWPGGHNDDFSQTHLGGSESRIDNTLQLTKHGTHVVLYADKLCVSWERHEGHNVSIMWFSHDLYVSRYRSVYGTLPPTIICASTHSVFLVTSKYVFSSRDQPRLFENGAWGSANYGFPSVYSGSNSNKPFFTPLLLIVELNYADIPASVQTISKWGEWIARRFSSHSGVRPSLYNIDCKEATQC